ncbi:hypothetical protein M9Y10_009200 [Tritrichomonas musculus]|uniref:Surface antigen BspA-like protein n=1 Tax=Tritrichomonas musculus TaxID=1915356 RepID=A0ABR2IMU0_9EUKA
MKSVGKNKLGIDCSSSSIIAAGSNNQEMIGIFFPKIGKSINAKLFKDNCTIVKIIIPPTIERIEKSAFEGCAALKEVIIPSSVTYICKNAFYKCKSLNHVIIPPSVTEIDSCAFGEYINLTDFKLILAKQLILDFMHIIDALISKLIMNSLTSFYSSIKKMKN